MAANTGALFEGAGGLTVISTVSAADVAVPSDTVSEKVRVIAGSLDSSVGAVTEGVACVVLKAATAVPAVWAQA